MRKKSRSIVSLLVFIMLVFPSIRLAQGTNEQISGSQRQIQRWHYFMQEHAIDRFWLKVSRKPRTKTFAVVDVNLISMAGRVDVRKKQTVVVSDGRIKAIGKSSETSIPKGAKRIDGTGKYLTPGLVDMHVHNLVTNSHQMLNLANGVTSVREMTGFGWMLDLRRRIIGGQLLAPNVYIAGHILNSRPMEYYATPVNTPEGGRLAVRDQISSGYDFIKIHNSVKPEVLSAIFDEAKQAGVDVVGHVPHQIKIADAISGGLRTMEHFKGYILDSTLTLTNEDYVKATKGKEVWNCPTFYTYRSHLRGTEAHSKVLDTEQMKYVAASDRKDWLVLAKNPPARVTKLRRNIFKLSKEIFKRLLKTDSQFIAGTDSGGGIPMLIPGFALHEELQIMENNGMPPKEALRAATINAAKAMRKTREFGTIEVGKRADLLLLSKNPLDKVRNLQTRTGVSVRGIWLSDRELSNMLAGIEKHYQMENLEDLKIAPTLDQIEKFVDSISEMRASGFVFRNYDLDEISLLLLSADQRRLARRVKSLQRR